MGRIIERIRHYFSLVTFSHTVFAMPFALIGFSLAVALDEYEFSARLLILVILCMVFARNAAMGFNRIADQHIDKLNPRTQGREIPSGTIKTGSAYLFVISNIVLFILTTWFINRLVFFLSPVALAIILGYSLTKRFTSLCHFILGLGLSLAPIGAYISVTGTFHTLPLIYSGIVITWVSGFDIIYALQDFEFDRSHDIYSLPASIGKKKALFISTGIHFITFLLVIAAGIKGKGGVLFWIGALIFSVLLMYQHLIIKSEDLSRVNMAFGTTNGIASIILAVFTITDIAIRHC